MARTLMFWLAIAGAAHAQNAAPNDLDQVQVDAAIEKGVKALKRRNGDHLRRFQFGGRPMSYCELVAFTYLHAGVAESDPDLKLLIDDLLARDLMATYCVSLQAMALEELDRVKHQKRILSCAKFLVDNQTATGSWGYGTPSPFLDDLVYEPQKRKDVATAGGAARQFEPPQPGMAAKPRVVHKVKVKKDRDGQASDNSNTQYAGLGLRACHDAGIILEEKVVDLAIKGLRDSQKNEKEPAEDLVEGGAAGRQTVVKRRASPQGWCYGDHDNHKAYGSMTAGAVGSLAIWDYIKDNDEGKRKSWKNDADIHEGLVWLSKKFSVTYNPGPYEPGNPGFEENSPNAYFYYMYALERAGMLYGTEVLGPHKWYPEGAKELIATQRPDGNWGGGTADTCFAILFLKRATRSLGVATYSAGQMREGKK